MRCIGARRSAVYTTTLWFSAAKLRPSKAYCNAATVLLMLQHHLPCGTRHYTFALDIRLDAAGSVAEQSKRKCHLAADVCLFSTGATMSGTRFFKTHRSWEDWVSMLIGVLIGFSPWLADQQGDQAVMWNAILVGALVLVLAQLEYVSLQRWEEIGEIIVGLWLIASPFLVTQKPARSGTGISLSAQSLRCLPPGSFGRTRGKVTRSWLSTACSEPRHAFESPGAFSSLSGRPQ